MSSYEELIKLINENKVNNPIFTCHDFSNKKRLSIDSNDIILFYKLYCDAVYNWTEGSTLGLGEVTPSNIPIISEFIFKFEKDIKSKQSLDEKVFYNKKLLHGLINCHHEVFKELIYISSNESEYICVCRESDAWQEGNLECIKIILQFPYCKVGKTFLSTTFRNRLLTRIRQGKLEGHFNHSIPIGDWRQHLLEIKDIYPLYGASNSVKVPAALYTGIYGEFRHGICRELSLENAYDYKQHQFIKNNQCIPEEADSLVDEESDQKEDYETSLMLLPLFCSLHFYSATSRVKIGNLQENETSSNASENSEYERENSNPSDMEIALDLIEFLKKDRFNKENYFLDIGRSLYNACEGDSVGLKNWIRLASEYGKFDEAYCTQQYENFDDQHITIKTLGWYARIDNPDKYRAWHENWCLPKLKECISNDSAHITVAEAFFRVFWLDYFYTGKRWVVYRKSCLFLLSEDIPLRLAITNRFIPYFNSYSARIASEHSKLVGQNNTMSKQRAEDMSKTHAAISKMIKKLSTDSYRCALVKTIREYFWKEDLSKILNKNPYLLGVKNCVIELNDHRAFVRPGKPEDYITKKVGVSYRSEYNFKHRDVMDLLVYFRQVFPNSQLNEFMKKDVASMLYGRNAEKVFRMWIGDTNGSKSVFQKMLRQMLGDYYCDLPPEFYSAQQRGGSGPSPELAQTDGARVVFSAEPDDDMAFKGARIKKITGGDSFYARSCNEDGGTIETSFKPVMVLNLVPDITGMDEATRNRFTMVPFEGRWLTADEAKESNLTEDMEEQIKIKTYRMDNRFEDNIPRLAAALLWMAVFYYKKYREEGHDNPPYIKKWMNDYWKHHDPYIAFITEKLENPKISSICKTCDHYKCENCPGESCQTCSSKNKCPTCQDTGFYEEIDVSKSVTATEIYREFKSWLKETHPQMQLIPKGKFVDILSTKDKLGKQREKKWWGLSLRKIVAATIDND